MIGRRPSSVEPEDPNEPSERRKQTLRNRMALVRRQRTPDEDPGDLPDEDEARIPILYSTNLHVAGWRTVPEKPETGKGCPVGPLLRSFGARLRIFRKRAGLSLRGLAAGAGLTKRCIVRLEQGDREPWLSTLRRLADALGVTVSQLIGDANG